MAIFTYPAALKVVRINWGQDRFDLRHENGDSGAGQSRLLGPSRWTANLVSSDTLNPADAALWRTTILQLKGRIHQLALHDLANPAPRGTLRGSLTLQYTVGAGVSAFVASGGIGQAGKTLLQGDWIGVGSGSTTQLHCVAADAVADVSGNIYITVIDPFRWQQTIGSTVVWDRPPALFRMVGSSSTWSHERAVRSGYSLDLRESWE